LRNINEGLRSQDKNNVKDLFLFSPSLNETLSTSACRVRENVILQFNLGGDIIITIVLMHDYSNKNEEIITK